MVGVGAGRFLTVVLCLSAAFVGGCSDLEPRDDVPSSEPTSTAAESAPRRPQTSEQLIAAVASAEEMRYRFQWAVTTRGLPDVPELTLSGDGAVDGAAERFTMTMDLSSMMEAMAASSGLSTTERAELEAIPGAGAIELLVDGDRMYMRAPFLTQELGVTTPWVSFSGTDFLGQSMGGLGAGMSPAAMLDLLQQAGDLRSGGTATVRGVATTQWSGTVDFLALAKAQYSGAGTEAAELEAVLPFLEGFMPGLNKIPVSLWLDDQGALRRFEMTMRFGGDAFTANAEMRMRYELFDFGAALNLAPPPASDTTDLETFLTAPRT